MSVSRSELLSSTLTLVMSFDPVCDHRSGKSRARTLQLLRSTRDPFSRESFEPGHMTASAAILSPDKTRTLLVYHRRLDRWLQPGGHVEPEDNDLLSTARREVLEETGVVLTRVTDAPLVGIDVHEIPAANGEPYHLHHDLTFCFTLETEERAESTNNPEVVWCRLDQLNKYGIDAPLRRSLRRALQHYGLSGNVLQTP